MLKHSCYWIVGVDVFASDEDTDVEPDCDNNSSAKFERELQRFAQFCVVYNA